MQNIIPPPIKNVLINSQKFVDNIWNQFFLGIYKLFSQPNYGSKPCTFSISGITGSYTTDYKWITDRDFVHFYITLVPTTSFVLTNATILPVLTNSENFDDTPLNLSNIQISLFTGTTIKDFRNILMDSTGSIKLPDVTSTSYSILVSGVFIKSF